VVKRTLGGIFSPVSRTHHGTYFNETYHDGYSLPGSHETAYIFKVMGSKVKVIDNISQKKHFCGKGILGRCFAVQRPSSFVGKCAVDCNC